jgi:hypothetical protein
MRPSSNVQVRDSLTFEASKRSGVIGKAQLLGPSGKANSGSASQQRTHSSRLCIMISGRIEPSLYLYADADGVRLSLERLLFEQRLDELSHLSSTLHKAVQATASALAKQFAGRVIIAAGDDILILTTAALYDHKAITDAMASFASTTGCTLSVGVGPTISECYINLRRAKSAGGGAIFVSLHSTNPS